MVNPISTSANSVTCLETKPTVNLDECSTLELAQALAKRLAISEQDWHRLKANRNARAGEQITAALVFLLTNQPEEVIPRLNQAINWLDHSISAPPCPSHGAKKTNP